MQELVKAKNTELKKTENQFIHEVFGNLTTITNELNEVFFVSNEVSSILDYSENRKMLERLDDDEIVKLSYEETKRLSPTVDIHSSGIQLLTESGLYSAVLGSRKLEAKQFKKWVTSEVLPSIRKTGIYATEVTIDKMLNDPDFAIALLTNLKNEKKLRQEAESKNAILMHVNKTYTTTEIAKEIGMTSGNQLNNILCSLRVQYKQNKTYVLYSNYAGNGYDDIKQEVLDSGHVIYHRKWTQLGRAFILNLLSKKQ
jgi:prophage antirepressor-like protein